jgi:hypothetical protein
VCVSWLRNLIFMKAKLLKVLSSSIEPNTITIVISATFMYSFNFWSRMADDWIFNHIWKIKFTSLDFCIIASSLWLMVSLKWEAWTSSWLEFKSLGIINPPFNFLSTQNVYLIRSKWGRNYWRLFPHISNTTGTPCQERPWLLHWKTYKTT